jgi:enoyl-[acyl-carrier protein] reductase I
MADEWVFPKGELMAGKRGLVMGVANDKSIAWGIASQLAAQGAELAFTYQGEALEKRVRPLVQSIGAKTMLECDATNDAHLDAVFDRLGKDWGGLDFLVHSIAFSDKNELKGSFIENTTRENFLRTMDISAFSFVAAGKRAAKLMKPGGSMVTLTYLGAERVLPSYNVMGVAKACLEASMHQRRRHAHARHRRHPGRTRFDSNRPRMVADEGRHRDGGHRRLCAVAALRSWALNHRRSRARGCGLSHCRRAGDR